MICFDIGRGASKPRKTVMTDYFLLAHTRYAYQPHVQVDLISEDKYVSLSLMI